MTKADYEHFPTEHAGRLVLVIMDLDLGGRSVTNDIENVVAEIEQRQHINAKEYLVVYRDSMGNWDGWDHARKQFVALFTRTWQSAATEYIKIQIAGHQPAYS
jgi:hypothetical protein